jgi:hypothetical protein
LKYRIGIVEWTKTDSLSGEVSFDFYSWTAVVPGVARDI